jgi:methyl-accepting chemotaxis protein
MHDAEDLMKDQQKKLDDTKAKFSEVSSGISVSIDGTEKIRTSADSCNEARATVMEVIANLSAISQGNAASSQETMSSMQELNETSRMLADKAGKLKEISQVLNEDMKFFKL